MKQTKQNQMNKINTYQDITNHNIITSFIFISNIDIHTSQ